MQRFHNVTTGFHIDPFRSTSRFSRDRHYITLACATGWARRLPPAPVAAHRLFARMVTMPRLPVRHLFPSPILAPLGHNPPILAASRVTLAFFLDLLPKQAYHGWVIGTGINGGRLVVRSLFRRYFAAFARSLRYCALGALAFRDAKRSQRIAPTAAGNHLCWRFPRSVCFARSANNSPLSTTIAEAP